MPALDALEAMLGASDFLVLALCIDDVAIAKGREFFVDVGIRNLALFWAEPLRVQLSVRVYRLADDDLDRRFDMGNRTTSGAL